MIVLSLALAASLFTAQPTSQRELNGFFLGQDKSVVTNTFHKPFQTAKAGDGTVSEAYMLDQDHRAFMAFEFTADAPTEIHAVQITGRPGTQMLPFAGLHLGDSRADVEKALGKPDHDDAMSDIPGRYLRFDHNNYSVELDADGRLSSIKIMGFLGFPDYEKQEPDRQPFLKALKDKDADELLDALMPDAVIYHGDKSTTQFSLPMRAEFNDPNSPMQKDLLTGSGSVASILAAEKSEPEENVRLTDDKKILMVFKYPKSKTITEIVYKWQAGKWRVWEVTLPS